MTDGLTRLAAPAILARRRPRAIIGMWVWQSGLALAASWPAAGLLRAATARSPFGDAALWADGALPLLALLSREANGVRAAIGAAAIILVFNAVAGLVPLAALMVSLGNADANGRAPAIGDALGAGIGAFRPFGLLLVAMTLGQSLLIALGIFLGQLAAAWMHEGLGEAHAQQVGLGVGALVMAPAVALGVMHDLARAAVIRFDLTPTYALVAAGRGLRATPVRLTWSWGWRGLASAAAVLTAANLAAPMGGRGGFSLFLLAAIHQTVVLARVALRASWLAKALRSADETTSVDASHAFMRAHRADSDR